MPFLQDLIHKLEVGGGMRSVKVGLAVLVILGGAGFYNFRNFKNMSSQEAMDAAQLGRSIAQGKGYTTLFIRPFSMYLLKKHNEAQRGQAPPSKTAEFTQIKDRHPDIANAPVYPLVLAGLMKVLPFDYAIPVAGKASPFWTNEGRIRYQPDFLISLFNQLLFFVVILLVFSLARRLFDLRTAWLSAILLFTTDLLWRFCVSGQSTLLLLLIFTGLIWCLVRLEAAGGQPGPAGIGLFALAIVAGLLIGLGGLTRYAFGWVMLPLLLFLVLFAGQQRFLLAALVLVAFLVVMTPWVVRNFQVSGTPFGTAGYALVENTPAFPDYNLQRSLDPEFRFPFLRLFTQKLLVNTRQILAGDLPRLGGSWLSAFFLVGLLVNLRQPAASRLRYFAVSCLGLLIVIQALGRTQLSEDSPELNSENLLVLMLPLTVIYGVRLFWLLLDQLELPFRELRYAVIGLFGLVVSLPMVFAFLPPKPSPVAYPPYYPPTIQAAAGWVKESELTMSDMPWAVAWYGQSQCLWLTLNPQSFVDITDYQKPIQELYLTNITIESRLLTHWILALEEGWGNLVLQSQAFVAQGPWPKRINLQVRQAGGSPASFPLHYWQPGWPDQFLLTAREKWPKSE